MALVLTEEQRSIQEMVRSFVEAQLPIAHFRALRDRNDPDGFSRSAWKAMARLGVSGMVIPPSLGGAGLGFSELGLVLEECGRALSPTPLLSTSVLGSSVIVLAGSEAQKKGLAHEEWTRHAPYRIATRAEPTSRGYAIRGNKTFVLDGHIADTFVVVARTSGGEADREGLALFLVPSAAPGVTIHRMNLCDHRNAARVAFDVEVPGDAVVGLPGKAGDVLDAVLDRAAVALSAEMLGGALEAFERTIVYLKTRKQFGVPIGSFQAIKHRAAHLFCEIELTKSIVMEALRAIDENRSDLSLLAATAKARASDTFLLVANDAIQLHGGIGVTDELDIGFFLKRARVAEMTFGDSAYHRDRFARLQGY
jgi:alkylation response protein AidB-like acyl-CoA dehydrogenase